MSHGLVSVFTKDVASGVTLTSSFDLGRGFRRVYLEVPTMASGSLYVQASSDDSTFRRVMIDNGNTSTVQQTFVVDSSVTARMVPIPAGFRYYKIENTSGATDTTTTFNIICSD